MIQNPFDNPDLLDGALADSLSHAEAWQAKHHPTEATVALGGLAEAARDNAAEAPSPTTAEGWYEQRGSIFSKAEQLAQATGVALPSHEKFNETLLLHLNWWKEMGCFDWIEDNPVTGEWDVIAFPNINVTVGEFDESVSKLRESRKDCNPLFYAHERSATISYDDDHIMQYPDSRSTKGDYAFQLIMKDGQPLQSLEPNKLDIKDIRNYTQRISALAALSGFSQGTFQGATYIRPIRFKNDEWFVLEGNSDELKLTTEDRFDPTIQERLAFGAHSHFMWLNNN